MFFTTNLHGLVSNLNTNQCKFFISGQTNRKCECQKLALTCIDLRVRLAGDSVLGLTYHFNVGWVWIRSVLNLGLHFEGRLSTGHIEWFNVVSWSAV